MQTMKRIVLGLALAVLAAVYTWVAAVRAVPGVKARKQARRDDRRNGRAPDPAT